MQMDIILEEDQLTVIPQYERIHLTLGTVCAISDYILYYVEDNILYRCNIYKSNTLVKLCEFDEPIEKLYANTGCYAVGESKDIYYYKLSASELTKLKFKAEPNFRVLPDGSIINGDSRINNCQSTNLYNNLYVIKIRKFKNDNYFIPTFDGEYKSINNSTIFKLNDHFAIDIALTGEFTIVENNHDHLIVQRGESRYFMSANQARKISDKISLYDSRTMFRNPVKSARNI
jgi:hypothetical protein